MLTTTKIGIIDLYWCQHLGDTWCQHVDGTLALREPTLAQSLESRMSLARRVDIRSGVPDNEMETPAR